MHHKYMDFTCGATVEPGEWGKEFMERWAQCKNDSRYYREFNLGNRKWVTKISDFTADEVKLWKLHLNENQDMCDLFDKTNLCIYNEEIRIIEWIWTHVSVLRIEQYF